MSTHCLTSEHPGNWVLVPLPWRRGPLGVVPLALRHYGSVTAPLLPLDTIAHGLVFAAVIPELQAALAEPDATAVIQAPPGGGKTTITPPLVANLVAGRTIVTQPRRVAARAAARRLRQLAPDHADQIGFTVRGESTRTSRTRIEFVTPGVLINRLLANPELPGVDAVILDEVHERALDTDLALGMLLDVRDLRGDLRLLALSATLNADAFARLMGGAPIIDSPQALHPLIEEWAPPDGPRLTERGVDRSFLAHVARTAAAAHRLHADSDTLVFLPGAWEVEQVARQLRGMMDADVFELHGQVPPREQDRIVSGRGVQDPPGAVRAAGADRAGPRRIVVSTALAESSLTVPGVRLVVDSMLAREPRRDAMRRMSGLVTITASRASMTQRAGRAARLGPGTVIRCADPAAAAGAAAEPAPEIRTADLTGAALTLAAWGTPGGRGLRLLDEPPAAALADAQEDLRAIGAIDETGQITERGRTLAQIPADPRLARALLDGAELVGPRTAAEVVALLAMDRRPAAQDLHEALALARRDDRFTREAARFTTLAARAMSSRQSGDASAPGTRPGAEPCADETSADDAAAVAALAFPMMIASRVADGPDGGSVVLLASGTRAGVPSGPLAAEPWLVVADASRSNARAAADTGAVVRLAAAISEPRILELSAEAITDEVTVSFTDQGAQARREQRLGAITLSSTPTRVHGRDARAAVLAGLRQRGLGVLHESAAAEQLRRRLDLLHRTLGAPWPDVSDAGILEKFELVASPELDQLAGAQGRPARPGSIDLLPILQRLLPWPEASRLGKLAPERLTVPSGSRIRLTYPEVGDDGGRVVAEVKLQEVFGLAESPALLEGAVRIQFHLLSPARRPLAVTDDLRSFWNGPYAQVRAEMRGRYPKHPWPEDPWSAQATARTTAAARGGSGRRIS